MTDQTKAHIESHARELYDSPHLHEKVIEAAIWGYELRDEEVQRLEENIERLEKRIERLETSFE